jgi:hypothetical protein
VTGAEFHGVDIDLLADFVGGALDGTPEADRVAALIAAEPAWQEAFELLAPEMATVGALLGELPVEPMPQDVVARLDAALATLAEPAATATTVGTASIVSTADTASTTSTAGTASTAEATDAVGPAATPGAGLDAETPGAGLGAGEAGAHGVPKTVVDLDERRRKRGNHRWVRWAAPIGIAAGAVAFMGYGLSRPQSSSDKASSEAAPAAGGAIVAATPAAILSSGLDYTLGTLGQSLKRATDKPLTTSADSGDPAPGLDAVGLARLRDPAALLDCLSAIAQENGAGALAAASVDYARFEGQPAVIVRFTADNGEWAWASGADCGLPSGDADTLGKVPVR